MRKFTRPEWRQVVKVVLWAVIGIFWLSILGRQVGHSEAASPREPRRNAASLMITNLTQSLEVAASTPEGDWDVRITLRNNSNKTVECFAYSDNPQRHVTTRSGTVDFGLLPGGTVEEVIGLRSELQRGEENPMLTILAVLFDDGSAEGSPRAVRVLLDVPLALSPIA
jgi:hypothetical protein